MTTIEKQIANNNSIINNAEQINNNIFDDPLKFFCDKKISEVPNLEIYFKAIQYMINKDSLKQRFGGANYKYNELVNIIDKYVTENTPLTSAELDDGYKSVIKCIAKAVQYFTMDEDGGRLKVNGANLYAEITDAGLEMQYSKEVITYRTYMRAKRKADQISKELAPFLNCATQYGNFFQFNNIFLEEIKDVPFITEEIKFHVSNKIIPNLIKPLYGESPECGLREIIQNACDASKELSKKGSDKDSSNSDKDSANIVEVHLFEENNTKKIRVRDYGIGMTKDVLLNMYFVIGESSKKNSELNLVGQFGIGSLAAFLLGDDIEVKTKHYTEKKLYHFSYTLNSNQDRGINIAIEQNDDFLHGTEVTINLNKQLSELSEKKLKEKLKLDEWYVLPDIPIEYYIEHKRQDIHTLIGGQNNWEIIKTSLEDIEVCYLEKTNGSQVILNGLIVPEKYNFRCKYLKNKPYIAIKSTGQAVKLNLERSRIESGLTPVLDILQEHLIKVGLEKFLEEKNNIVDEQLIIRSFKYSNEYLIDVPLIFNRNGFGIYSRKTINKIQTNEAIVRVYGTNGYPNIRLSDLSDNVLYLFYDCTLQKSDIADFVEGSGSTYIPNQIIKQYFYNATSQHNGFRFNTMKKLYVSLKQQKPAYDSATEFWQNHNKNKKNVFSDFFDEPKNILVGENYFSIVDKVKRFCSSSIINILPKGYPGIDIIDDNIDIGFITMESPHSDGECQYKK